MAEIKLNGIDKIYPGGTHAVHGVDLNIADGEFMIMVGPSGCAKSTILRMIAGLEQPSDGTIEIGGRVVNNVPAKDRDIAMVFQSYALYPHMTVRENMAFGLKLRNMPEQEINQRVLEAAHILGLESLLDRLPKAMSGGQRQRVAMGRAIVREPQAFLMDEPLSNLDAKLRVQMRTEIAKLHQRLGTTTVYVTHDQVEALTLGQRICILRKGLVQQVDTPYNVYQNPKNVFVGGFIGSPGMNFLTGQLHYLGNNICVRLGDYVFPLPQDVASRLYSQHTDGQQVIIGIRPEHLSLSSDSDTTSIAVRTELVESMGSEQYVYFNCDIASPDLSNLSDTQAISSAFTARIDSSHKVQSNTNLWLHLDMRELHIFDAQSMETMLSPLLETTDNFTAPVEAIKDREEIVITNTPDIYIPSTNLEIGLLPNIEHDMSEIFTHPFKINIQSNTSDDPKQTDAYVKPPSSSLKQNKASNTDALRGFSARPLNSVTKQQNVKSEAEEPISADVDIAEEHIPDTQSVSTKLTLPRASFMHAIEQLDTKDSTKQSEPELPINEIKLRPIPKIGISLRKLS